MSDEQFMKIKRHFVEQGLSYAYIPYFQHHLSVGQKCRKPRHCHDYHSGQNPRALLFICLQAPTSMRGRKAHTLLVRSQILRMGPTLHEEMGSVIFTQAFIIHGPFW